MEISSAPGRIAMLLCGAALATALTACAPSASESADATSAPPSATTAAPAPTATAVPALTAAQLSTAFTSIQFQPGKFAQPSDLFASIYPGVEANPACLAVLGVGAPAADGAAAFGPSIDRTLTAHVTSSDEATAEKRYTAVIGAAASCISAPGVVFRGDPVEVQVAQQPVTVPGADEAIQLTMGGDILGQPFSVIGIVARGGGDVVLLAGWDPATNATNVPLASRMMLDALQKARR